MVLPNRALAMVAYIKSQTNTTYYIYIFSFQRLHSNSIAEKERKMKSFSAFVVLLLVLFNASAGEFYILISSSCVVFIIIF